MYKLFSTLDIFVAVFPNSKPFLWHKKKWELECFVGWVNSTTPRLYTGSAAAAERRKRKEGGSWGSACSNTLTHLFGGSGGKKQEEGDDFTRDERGKSPKKINARSCMTPRRNSRYWWLSYCSVGAYFSEREKEGGSLHAVAGIIIIAKLSPPFSSLPSRLKKNHAGEEKGGGGGNKTRLWLHTSSPSFSQQTQS